MIVLVRMSKYLSNFTQKGEKSEEKNAGRKWCCVYVSVSLCFREAVI